MRKTFKVGDWTRVRLNSASLTAGGFLFSKAAIRRALRTKRGTVTRLMCCCKTCKKGDANYVSCSVLRRKDGNFQAGCTYVSPVIIAEIRKWSRA